MTNGKKKPFAKRSFGQNFLHDLSVIKTIVEAADIRSNDTVVEIGPGRGALTGELLKKAGRVIGIELDRDLIAELSDRFRDVPNFELIHADVLKLDLTTLAHHGPLKLVGNLPYNISTAILQRFVENAQIFKDAVVMLQREVVDRILAEPGDSQRGYLTVIIEACTDVQRVIDVPPSAFRPVPAVWSSVIRLQPREIDMRYLDALKLTAGAAFRNKRKTILNNLKSKYPDASDVLELAGIAPKRRAETLDAQEWRSLTLSLTTF